MSVELFFSVLWGCGLAILSVAVFIDILSFFWSKR